MDSYDLTQYAWHNLNGPSELDVAWAGGLFEGEGCLTTSKSHGYANILAIVQMTDLDSLLRFQWSVQIGKVNGPYRRKGVDHKPFWKWKVASHSEVCKFIFKILPYLGDRRQTRACQLLSIPVGKFNAASIQPD